MTIIYAFIKPTSVYYPGPYMPSCAVPIFFCILVYIGIIVYILL